MNGAEGVRPLDRLWMGRHRQCLRMALLDRPSPIALIRRVRTRMPTNVLRESVGSRDLPYREAEALELTEIWPPVRAVAHVGDISTSKADPRNRGRPASNRLLRQPHVLGDHRQIQSHPAPLAPSPIRC